MKGANSAKGKYLGASRRSLCSNLARRRSASPSLAGLSACNRGSGSDSPRRRFYNWDTYVGETTLADFQQASGDTSSDEVSSPPMTNCLHAFPGNPGFDVIVPSERVRRA